MIRFFSFLFFFTCLLKSPVLYSQNIYTDTSYNGNLTIIKDRRADILVEKMTSYSALMAKKPKIAYGYRLMVLNTTDRSLAMKLRTNLMARYPDQQVYMVFLSPYIKVKFGNFIKKAEADKVRKEILASKLVSGNIYLVPETIEIKPEGNPTDE